MLVLLAYLEQAVQPEMPVGLRSLPEEDTQSEKTGVDSCKPASNQTQMWGVLISRGWGCRVVQRDPALATASNGCSADWIGIM